MLRSVAMVGAALFPLAALLSLERDWSYEACRMYYTGDDDAEYPYECGGSCGTPYSGSCHLVASPSVPDGAV